MYIYLNHIGIVAQLIYDICMKVHEFDECLCLAFH